MENSQEFIELFLSSILDFVLLDHNILFTQFVTSTCGRDQIILTT